MKQDKREYAKRLMTHYIKWCWPDEANWDWENVQEIGLLVDAIIDAAVEEMSRKEKED